MKNSARKGTLQQDLHKSNWGNSRGYNRLGNTYLKDYGWVKVSVGMEFEAVEYL